jgi:group I intron endonuclease
MENNEIQIGYVYMITNPKDKIYIGSTRSIKVRWDTYKRLKCNSQSKLYNSLLKYGYENHIFEIIWYGDIKDMLKYEYLIGINFDTIDKGLNLRLPKIDDSYNYISLETRSLISKFHKNKPKSESHKRAMSLARIGHKMSEESKLKLSTSKKRLGIVPNNIHKLHELTIKPIIQYDLNGSFIKSWESIAKASRELELKCQNINRALKKKHRKCGKYYWRYLDENFEYIILI